VAEQRSDDDQVAVIACTEDELQPYVLPRDPKAAHRATDEERVHLKAAFLAWKALTDLGWRDARHAPRDGSSFLVIEPGSTGVHEAYRDEHGFWIYDGDTWPSWPVLWKPLSHPPQARKEDERGE